ncbi:FMN-binding glutamate synthase family protein [Aureliella helgolandensis]|uniref:FMN-binding glutamate synthase family protein n=1 Tax=Aureliella helgolandensis TaxID=2527968 RepID=UPI0018D05B41|nr:FMN-binding glutamate synthase family protein [Aureliella helgolandensis]
MLVSIWFPLILWSWVLIGPLALLGLYDYFQTKHSILRNFPLLGRMRYLMELVRPEIYQYFIESDTEGVPFDRDQRSLVYQRAKRARDTVPFGTKEDVYVTGYEWVNHSMAPLAHHPDNMRVTIGHKSCSLPYSCSLLNISAMSFGSLSKNAVLSLSGGAKLGNFAHNTGEGGISPYHLAGGGDLIWQIGTGYFGCRLDNGQFCKDLFRQNASLANVKMIEIKLSQGAKPGHGGILPAAKVTAEISQIRHVPMGRDVISPPGHSAFSTPIELLEFVAQLRELSGGKPVGFKLCVGKRREFLAVCKAMQKTGITPDYIAVDGGEGGTGAAPLEFSNHIGAPLFEGLIFVHNALRGFSLREDIKLIASGKVSSGFGILKLLALGADACYSARSMMLALGCIQALQCNSNHCPVGVATQDKHLMAGLVPSDKRIRVANFHHETLKSFCEMLGAIGLASPVDLRPWHVMHRVSPVITKHYGELYDYLEEGALLREPLPEHYRRAVESASAETFGHVPA